MAPAFRHSQHVTPESPQFPVPTKMVIIHGTKDTAVDIEDSRKFLSVHKGANVRLIEQDDDHDNHKIIDSDQLKKIMTEVLE